MMITFKNLEPSQLARDSVLERVLAVTEKFPALDPKHIKIVLEMKNSQLQAGPDLFSIQLHVASGRYKHVTMTKSSTNLYVAVAEVCDLLLNRLNQHSDRARVKSIKQARKLKDTQSRLKIDSELDSGGEP